jgi:hypothetical protein
MNLYSVAIGDRYEKEVDRLKRTVQQSINVFTKSDINYVQQNNDSLVDGLYHKVNFANYIEEAEGPVIFMDADMFTLKENPFSDFNIESDVDIAYVPYVGRWFLPDSIMQEVYDFHGHKINSGFIYFKNLNIAKDICTSWAEEFLKRPVDLIKYEYDEYSLMIALKNKTYKVKLLDSKWNDWELSTEEEIKESNSVFFQSHDFLDIDLKTN